MKSITRLTSTALIAAIVPAALLYIRAHACGPDWEPEVFVPQNHPASMSDYADGHLGLIQRSYYHAELVIAYRYLTGGSLSPAEKAAVVPQPEPSADQPRDWEAERKTREAAQPIAQWFGARAKYAKTTQPTISPERIVQRKAGIYIYQDNELNCTDGAFVNAAVTLNSRAKLWGASSPEIQEWIAGQDAVFANCRQPSTLPSAAQSGWPKLLQQDRAYQTAAAEFYAQQFEAAIRDFEAIGHDSTSPWSRWGEYLAVRAEVRDAAQKSEPSDSGNVAAFDTAELQVAQARATRLLHTTRDPAVQHAAKAELQFIQVRLDPSGRLDDAANALAGPAPDVEFQQDLTDLDVLLDRGTQGNAPLTRWIKAMQGPPEKQHVEDGGVVWLVAKISAASTPDSQLMAAAAALPPTSPAYMTADFHRARLLAASGHLEDARSVLSTLLAAAPAPDPGTRNALLQERMPTAHTLDQFLADAPRSMMDATSQAASLTTCAPANTGNCIQKLPQLQFDDDGSSAFNQQLPLALWVQAARSTVLPEHLRQAIAWAGWLRAIGLGDASARKQLASMLPAPVRATAGESDGFHATLAILREPGLQPYLIQGVQRSASYATLDSFRNNWWCSRWGDGLQLNLGNSPGVSMPPPPPPLSFLTSAQRRAAEAEVAQLNALPNATMWLGQRTLDYVKAHPDDKDAAEALALVVRATHYSCSGEEKGPQRALSKEAFDLLHKRYGNTEWARKTKYYY